MSKKTAVLAPPVTHAAQYRPPAGACDCHAHIFGPYQKFPMTGRDSLPLETPLEAYLRMHEILGFERGVLSQGSHYGIDNSCLLDALPRTNGAVKGIVCLNPEDLTDSEIPRLDALGVCGVRLSDKNKSGPKLNAIEAIAERLKGTRWHLDIVPESIEDVVAFRQSIEKLSVPVLFDGMGHPDVTRGLGDPSFQIFLAMVRDGLVWVKLSHVYHLAAHPYTAVLPFVQALVEACPTRCVFAVDWPHPRCQRRPPMPDDGFLLDLFPQWVPDEGLQRTILVDNAAELYGF